METKSFFARRRIQKQAKHLLKGARHVCNLREDVAAPDDVRRLSELMQALSAQLRSENYEAVKLPAAASSAVVALATKAESHEALPTPPKQCLWAYSAEAKLLAAKAGLRRLDWQRRVEQISDQLAEAVRKINPPRPHAVLRENVEVIIVALAVAMAFRTYFVQPFKIPTSSMYPTLAGIHYIEKERKSFSDYFPFNLIKWAVFGQTYIEVKAQSTGLANISQTKEGLVINVGGIVHKIDPNMSLHVGQNDTVLRGQSLASGMKVAGDHIFVNKVKWNFMKPERGEIMVFKTDGIRHPQIRPNEHYVKRMVGLPGETVGIATPFLYINGKPATGVGMIDKIQACSPGYNGYIQSGDFMTGGVDSVKLNESQYFACGDNQRNSLDGRYWGPVPRKNLVGPAFFVYWPVSTNWGPAR